MTNVFGFLEELEKLAYKLLLLVMMIPKTFFMVVLYPRWARVYVKHQLRRDKDSPFDEYLSPVLLLLAVFILPALAIFILPDYGGRIITPEPGSLVEGSSIDFFSETKFISNTSTMYHEFVWKVEKIEEDEEGAYLLAETGDFIFKEVFQETHSENQWYLKPQAGLHFIGANTVRDHFQHNFSDSKGNRLKGGYRVTVTAANFDDPEDPESIGEQYESEPVFIFVPEDEAEEISISTFGFSQVEGANIQRNATNYFQDEKNILLVLLFLMLPLLFAAATKYRPGKPLSQSALMENFYLQCYYFTPVILSIWGFILYSSIGVFKNVVKGNLYDSMYGYWLAPIFITLLWFVGVETDAVSKERGISRVKSFLLTMAGIVIILVGLFVYILPPSPGTLLEYGLKAYPFLFGLSLVVYGLIAFRKWRSRSKKRWFRLAHVSTMALLGIAIAALAVTAKGDPLVTEGTEPEQSEQVADLIEPTLLLAEPPAATEPAITETEVPTVPTVPAPQLFYTEEFDSTSDNWSPFFPLVGDESMVEVNQEQGALVFQLSPEENKRPQVYFINYEFLYADVKVEAVTTNNGNNANETSLICRSGDSGWYEFGISSSGLYSIYAVDIEGVVNQGYNLLSNGGSAAIKTGKTTNVFTAVCRGDELSLYANDQLVKTVTDNKFNFREGYIGLGVSSPQSLPVDIQFDSITVSEP